MFKRFCLTLVVAILLCASISWAETYNITATWIMEAPTDLAGFSLRINDNDIIDISDVDARAWSGLLNLNDDNNTFEVQAIDLAGQVSGWSDPAYFNPPPSKPILTIIILQ